MNDTITSLTKLAEDLTSRVDALEKENAQLKVQASELSKQASVKVEAAPVISEQTVDATLERLVKVGSLNEDQLAESRKVLLSDAEAPHRMLQRILDAQLQAKTASAEENENLTGGRLATNTPSKEDPQDACMTRMRQILGMN